MGRRLAISFALASLVMGLVIGAQPLYQWLSSPVVSEGGSSVWLSVFRNDAKTEWANGSPARERAVEGATLERGSAPQSDLAAAVDANRLLEHVSRLSGPRHTPDEKLAARQYLDSQLRAYGWAPMLQPYSVFGEGSGGTNLVATLPGSDPSAGMLILGAHYDSVEGSPGADDNASAIAALLEIARLLAAQSKGATAVTLAFFDQEEQQADGTGLLGSQAFVQELVRDWSPDQLAGVKGAIILDMVGYACRNEGCQHYPRLLPLQNLPSTGDFLAVLGLEDSRDLIEPFVASAQHSGPRILSLPIPRAGLKVLPDLMRSDHVAFWNQGLPAVLLTDTANFRNPYYHTAQDTLERVDLEFLQGNTQHLIKAVRQLLE